MKRVCLLSLLVLATSWAGCVTNGSPTAPDVDAASWDAETDRVFPWSLTDCAFVVAFVPVDRAALMPHIPDGFTLEDDALGVEVFTCAAGEGLNGSVTGLAYGSYFASVTPPAHLAIDDIDDYYYKWWVLVPDEPRRTVFDALGMPVLAGWGAIDADVTAVGPLHEAVMHVDGVGSHRFRSLAPEVDEGGGGGSDDWFAEFTPLEGGGFATWRSAYTVSWSAGGPGTIEVPPGGFAAEVLGATVARASINTGVWSFHDGEVRFPVAEAGPPRHDDGHAHGQRSAP